MSSCQRKKFKSTSSVLALARCCGGCFSRASINSYALGISDDQAFGLMRSRLDLTKDLAEKLAQILGCDPDKLRNLK